MNILMILYHLPLQKLIAVVYPKELNPQLHL